MNFRQLLAKYVTGNITTDQLPDIAIKALEEKLNSPSLCILAGLHKSEIPSQVDHYFKYALEELNIPLPDKRQAALEYSFALVDEIVDGKKEMIEAVNEIFHRALDRYDFDSENIRYRYDSIGFETAYGLFVTYNDLRDADRPWQAGKTNEELMIEVKEQLLQELIKWKNKNLAINQKKKHNDADTNIY